MFTNHILRCKLRAYFTISSVVFIFSYLQLSAQCAPDVVPPVANCQNINAPLDATGNISITTAMIDNSSTDNCIIASMAFLGSDQIDFDCSDLGNLTIVHLIVTDGAGLTSSCSATVTPVDNTGPTASAQNIVVNLDASGNASITDVAVNFGSTDNCGIATYSTDQTDFDCTDFGSNVVTLTVTDFTGNSSTTTATVTVNDNISPVPNLASIPNDTSSCSYTATPPTATDNCNSSLVATTLDPVTFSSPGNYNITWTYTDIGGNVVQQVQTVVMTTCFAGINENDPFALAIYPNPSNGKFKTKLELQGEPIQIRVVTSVGQLVHIGWITSNETSIELNHLAEGIYHVSLSSSKGSTTRQIIIQK